jgi:hypothetical protein
MLIGIFLTTCCKERTVLGFGAKVSAIKKIQIPKHKYQTNHNDRKSKSQTIGF